MKKDDLISVVIPTFNRKRFLLRAINSVFKQSFKNYEIIIVDNYSSDGTEEMIKKIKSKKIRFYKNKNYGIIANARNFGIRKSKGFWIALLDSDDFWYKNKLKNISQYFKENDAIFHDLDSSQNKFYKKKVLKNIKILNFFNIFDESISLPNSSAVIKKKVFKRINYLDENKLLIGAEDHDGWLRMSKKNFKMIKIFNSFGFRNINTPDSETSPKRAIVNTRYIIKKFNNVLKNDKKNDIYFNKKYYKIAISYYILSDIKNALKYLNKVNSNSDLLLLIKKFLYKFAILFGFSFSFFRKFKTIFN